MVPYRQAIAKSLPISTAEFSRVFPLTKPPSGWSDTLVVANSGGPDSTCLLFLLNRHLIGSRDGLRNDLPKRLISFTVDHDLQASSSEMARHAANVAKSLGVEHITEKLPWGKNGLPPKPHPGQKIEGIARMMRYRVFFENLKNLGADAVAFGHHLDDQVETMLMRLGRGASKYGLAAMRPCRRWGMGNDSQEQYGVDGLSRWIIRPLLSFEKDRILATCTENGLSYVKDPTNSQPEVTLRNAIRDKVRENATPWENRQHTSDENQISQEMVQGLKSIQAAAEKAKLNFSLDTPLDLLRQESNHISATVHEQEAQVDEIIEKCRLPSPPGTFMISAVDLEEVFCPDTKDLLLFRISRYISPEPWGNPRAELGRRKSSVERLRQHLSTSSNIDTSICVGSQVWWRPLSFSKRGIRATLNNASLHEIVWLSQRQPPAVTSVTDSSGFEISKEHLMRRDEPMGMETKVLFDGRFVIHIHPEKVPQDIVSALSSGWKVVIEPSQQWFLPEIILRGQNADRLIHTCVTWPYDWRKMFRYRKGEVVSDWATIDYIRPISAI